MGCGSSKAVEEEKEKEKEKEEDVNIHRIATTKKFEKIEPKSYVENPNKYITSSTNYLKKQKPNSGKFIDDKFPPKTDTVYGKINGEYTDTNSERRAKALKSFKFSPADVEWKHAKEIWGNDARIFGDTISLEDIKLGEVPDAYFVATLSALAEFPSLILQLFKTTNIPEDGSAVEVAMQIDGDWKIIPLDDMFPINKKTGKPLFSDSPTKCLWGVFLEKAWAKANGGYANIVNGYPREVFEAFTPFTTVPIEVGKENKNALWESIKNADKYNCIMTCTIKEGTPDLDKVGLLENHSFSLVSAFERKVNGENVRLIKLRNPFGMGEWNGDWSDNSSKWTAAAKKVFPEFDEKRANDGIFWIDFDNFCKYFQIVSICVPVKPFSSTYFKVDKDKAIKFNVMKIKVQQEGILSITVYKKSYRFHRKIQPDQEVIENLILAKCNNGKFEYLDSAYNETMSTEVKTGEYICLYNVDYNTAGVPVRKYAVTISGSCKFQLCHLESDDDHSLMKKIMIPKIESIKKYEPLFQKNVVLFTGNRFEQTAIGFFYIKSRMEGTIHLEPKVFFQNIKSIDGELPKGLKMEKNTIFLYLGNRVKAALPFRTGGNGKTVENAVPGEVTPKLDENKIKNYGNASNYEDVKIAFEC